jgi:hypothetical protein
MAIEIVWNNTSIDGILRCAEAWRRRWLEGEIIPPGVAATRGSTVHAVIRANLRGKLQGEQPFSATEARDLAADEFEGRWSQGVALQPAEEAEGVEKVKGEAKDASVDLSGLHARDVAPGIQPVAVEEQIKVTPRGTSIVLHGTIDLVETVAGPGQSGYGIRDVKTKEKSPQKDEANLSGQLTMYGMLFGARYGKPPSRMVLDHLVRTPVLHGLKYVPQETLRDASDYQALIQRIGAATHAVEKGVFLPARESDWWCSPRWCGYYATCPYVSRRKRPQD